MPAKPNTRNWNDVQTAIATVAIVATLGLWNLFATPSKAEAAAVDEPTVPPTEPPVTEIPAAVMPQVKIMFTPVAPQQTDVVQQTQEKKKKNTDNNNNTKKKKKSVTQTQSS